MPILFLHQNDASSFYFPSHREASIFCAVTFRQHYTLRIEAPWFHDINVKWLKDRFHLSSVSMLPSLSFLAPYSLLSSLACPHQRAPPRRHIITKWCYAGALHLIPLSPTLYLPLLYSLCLCGVKGRSREGARRHCEAIITLGITLFNIHQWIKPIQMSPTLFCRILPTFFGV